MKQSFAKWITGWIFALLAAGLYLAQGDARWFPIFPALVSIGYFTDAAAEKICERFGK